MGKALKVVGTAIVVAGLVVATGGAALAMGAGVGLTGAVGLGFTATSLSVGGFSISAGGLIAGGRLIAGLGGQRPPAASEAASSWTRAPVQPIPFAFGAGACAGKIIHQDEFGPDNMYEAIVTVISGAGPITSFGTFKADDQTVTFNGSGKAVSSQWTDEMWMQTRLGAQPETAHTSPTGLKNSVTMPSWGAAYALSGKASFMLTLAENSKSTAYPGGEPKPLIEWQGLKCWDPREDSTYPGGAGTCRLNDPATWIYSANGAIHALRWTLGLWEDPVGEGAPGVGTLVGGIGSSLDGIDVAAFVYAANIADDNGWTCAAWPNSQENKHQVLSWFLQAAGAVPSRIAGRISCISRGAAQSSLLTVTARDTAGPIEIDAAKPRLDRINTITPSIWSPGHKWEITPLEPVTVPEYVTEDAGERPRGITYPYVTATNQGAQLATYDIVDSREGITGTIPFKPHMRRIKPGDCFTISEPGFVLDGQKVKCWGRTFDPQSMVVRIRFTSETDAKHAFALGKTGVAPPSPALDVVDPTVVTAPAPAEWSLTAESLTEGLGTIPALVFNGAVENAKAERVVFEYRVVDTPERSWAGAGGEDPNVTRKEVTAITTGTIYEGAVSYRIGSRVSERLILGPVTAGDVIIVPPGARIPISRSVPYPISVDDDSITVDTAHTVYFSDGSSQAIPTGSVTGLTSGEFYGLFYRTGDGFEAELQPATGHMTTGRWIFLDWWATSTAGAYPAPETPPPGYGGGGAVYEPVNARDLIIDGNDP